MKLSAELLPPVLVGMLIGAAVMFLMDFLFWRPGIGLGEETHEETHTPDDHLQKDFDRIQAENLAAKKELAQLREELVSLRATAADKAPMGMDSMQPEMATPIAEMESAMSPMAGDKDPFEDITGIGRVFQQRLWDAGIVSFAQLAAMTPESIREVIKPESWQAIDPAAWIASAAELAKGK